MQIDDGRSHALGENIKRLRTAARLTQVKLCQRAVTSSIAMIEAGKIASPRYSTLQAIAKALGVTVADLFAEPKPERRRRKAKGA
jgi:transcriptional regulator with XRE-family HTH domain